MMKKLELTQVKLENKMLMKKFRERNEKEKEIKPQVCFCWYDIDKLMYESWKQTKSMIIFTVYIS